MPIFLLKKYKLVFKKWTVASFYIKESMGHEGHQHQEIQVCCENRIITHVCVRREFILKSSPQNCIIALKECRAVPRQKKGGEGERIYPLEGRELAPREPCLLPVCVLRSHSARVARANKHTATYAPGTADVLITRARHARLSIAFFSQCAT